MRNQVECIPPITVEHVQENLGRLAEHLGDIRDRLHRYAGGLARHTDTDRVLAAEIGAGLVTTADDLIDDAAETLARLATVDRESIDRRQAEVRDLSERLGSPWTR